MNDAQGAPGGNGAEPKLALTGSRQELDQLRARCLRFLGHLLLLMTFAGLVLFPAGGIFFAGHPLVYWKSVEF